MRAYSSPTHYFPATTPNDSVLQIPVPNNLFVQQLTVVAAGAFSATAYRVNPEDAGWAVDEVTADPVDGKAVVRLQRPHNLRGLAYAIQIEDTGNVYPGLARILQYTDEYSLKTSLTYSSDVTAGILRLQRIAARVEENQWGDCRFIFARDASGFPAHRLEPGDKITVAGLGSPPAAIFVRRIAQHRYLPSVSGSSDAVDTDLDYGDAVADGMSLTDILIGRVDSGDQALARLLFPTTAAASKLVNWTDSFGRGVGHDTQRLGANDPASIYVKITGAGGAQEYYIVVSGFVGTGG